jgi:hypothetical protein
MSLIYLASPYTQYADTPERLEYAVTQACRTAAALMLAGGPVFSPVVHSHYIADHLDPSLRLNHDFWLAQDIAVLRHATSLVVLRLPGWEGSRGIARELAVARSVGLPVSYVDPLP